MFKIGTFARRGYPFVINPDRTGLFAAAAAGGLAFGMPGMRMFSALSAAGHVLMTYINEAAATRI
jgi:hypothetical protein